MCRWRAARRSSGGCETPGSAPTTSCDSSGQVATHIGEDDLGKVLLLTDGLSNTGLTDPPALVQHVAELRARGVLTSTFGAGTAFNQPLLDGMAKSGGGNFYFVEHANQLEDLLTSEVCEALETLAREVAVAFEHTYGMHVRVLDAFVHGHGSCGLMTRLGSSPQNNWSKCSTG